MKGIKINLLLVGVLLSALVWVGCEKETSQEENISVEVTSEKVSPFGVFKSVPIEGKYIVEFTDDFGNSFVDHNVNFKQGIIELKNRVVKDFPKLELSTDGITHAYGNSIKGFAATLSVEQYELLIADKRIKYIEQDHMIIMVKPDKPGKPGNGGDDGEEVGQSTPYGIIRVGGISDGTGLRAWIIDSGIDMDHPDLNVDQNLSVSFLSGGPQASNPNDQNGHGTHVAGTIAAKNNNIGVVGVAADATVVAVRVLDRKGSGSWSGVIAGINYVGANGVSGDVANMSLGGGVSVSVDNAVSAASSNVKFSIAAGNSNTYANNSSPARVNGGNIYTVSAMDSGDDWASFSNYGNPPVDYCAPGVAIHSTWKNGGYNTISGTSMAAPHVAGILLLGGISTDGTVNGDPDGNPDPIAHN